MADKKVTPSFNLFSWVSEQFRSRQVVAEESRENANPSTFTKTSLPGNSNAGFSSSRPTVRSAPPSQKFFSTQEKSTTPFPKSDVSRAMEIPMIMPDKSTWSTEPVSTDSNAIKASVYIKLPNGRTEAFSEVGNLDQLHAMIKDRLKIQGNFTLFSAGKPLKTIGDFEKSVLINTSNSVFSLVIQQETPPMKKGSTTPLDAEEPSPLKLRTDSISHPIYLEPDQHAKPQFKGSQFETTADRVIHTPNSESVVNASFPDLKPLPASTDLHKQERSVHIKLINGQTAFFDGVTDLDKLHTLIKERFNFSGKCILVAGGKRVETPQHFTEYLSPGSGYSMAQAIPSESDY